MTERGQDRFCVECAAEFEAGDRYCVRCGSPRGVTAPRSAGDRTQEASVVEVAAPDDGGHRGRHWEKRLAVGVAAAVLCFAALLLLTGGDEASVSPAASQPPGAQGDPTNGSDRPSTTVRPAPTTTIQVARTTVAPAATTTVVVASETSQPTGPPSTGKPAFDMAALFVSGVDLARRASEAVTTLVDQNDWTPLEALTSELEAILEDVEQRRVIADGSTFYTGNLIINLEWCVDAIGQKDRDRAASSCTSLDFVAAAEELGVELPS